MTSTTWPKGKERIVNPEKPLELAFNKKEEKEREQLPFTEVQT